MTKWTKKEETQLMKLWKQGLTAIAIAKKMNRTVGSVRQRIYRLQAQGTISKRNGGRKPKNQPKQKIINEPYLKKIMGSSQWGKNLPSNLNIDKYNKALEQAKPVKGQDESSFKISKTMGEITKFLLDKNDQYGDSALQPIRIFSRADKTEQLKVRIDDKLNRLMQGNASLESDEDVVKDLIGYLVLLLVNMRE
tara:strand:- start:2870 stop:3451 length:582 start_codon:yes stop_codon:yes gene_type:complete